ncbi:MULTISPECIES: cupin domain-containing protein [Maribacter]|uniref:Cupin domain-containing protein n=2 Tax=Maribacter TaxID=252356 RepID=A0A5R8MBU8_9FLAO|nr:MULTISPECIES: cupin domain-containing protein [Maribacter]KAA2219023.1 cupin domain-containing protein [Maribacter flavus]TLF46249.1 cupin domain-containing protein [Maribacter aurantiacus]
MEEYFLIDRTIKNQPFSKLQIHRLVATEAIEILSISLEKGVVFPEHVSPTDAQLIVLEGCIAFHIKGKEFIIGEQETIRFKKEEKHWVKATKNSKFLIIRPH